MNERLKKLYQEVIVKESKVPYQFIKTSTFEKSILSNNPLCGDNYTIYISTEVDQISGVAFYGFGCAISKASHSLMLRIIEGKSIAESKLICASFLNYIETESDVLPDELASNLEAFSAVKSFPGRKTCVIGAWQSVLNGLKEMEEKNQ